METLAMDCQVHILRFLPLKDVLACRYVCHAWKNMLSIDAVRKDVVKKLSIPDDIPDDWKFNHSERSVWKILDLLGPSLTDLSIGSESRRPISTEFMTALTVKFPSLRRLYLDRPILPADLELISRFRNLRFLRLDRGGLHAGDAIIGNQGQGAANLRAWKIILESLHSLCHLHLDVGMCFAPPADHFDAWPALEKLELSDVEVIDYSAFCVFISKCLKLTNLDFRHGSFSTLDPLLSNATDKLTSALPAGLTHLCLLGYRCEEPFKSVMNLDQVWFKFERLQELKLDYILFKRSIHRGIHACLNSSKISSLQTLDIIYGNGDGECSPEEVKAIGCGSFKLSRLSLPVSTSTDAAVFKELVQNQPNLESLMLFCPMVNVQIGNAGFLEEIICKHPALTSVSLANIEFLDQVAILKSIIDRLSSASPSIANGIDFPASQRRIPLSVLFRNNNDGAISDEDKAELMADKRAEDYVLIEFQKGNVSERISERLWRTSEQRIMF